MLIDFSQSTLLQMNRVRIKFATLVLLDELLNN